MLPINAYTIRSASDKDHLALARLALLDSHRQLTGRIIVAEDDGEIIAARSLDDGRAIADPFKPSAIAALLLRSRAEALVAAERTPLLRDRLRLSVGVLRPNRPGLESAD